jgi:lambda repressor-like predicted transcriptional regulator
VADERGDAPGRTGANARWGVKDREWTAADLRAWIERRGLTQEQAAEALGLHQPNLNAILQGGRPLRPYTVKLARALDRVAELEPPAGDAADTS